MARASCSAVMEMDEGEQRQRQRPRPWAPSQPPTRPARGGAFFPRFTSRGSRQLHRNKELGHGPRLGSEPWFPNWPTLFLQDGGFP